MRTKLRYIAVMLILMLFAMYGCDKVEPDQKLSLGVIGYDSTSSILHWDKVENAVNYNLTISGDAVTSTINEVIDDSYYVEANLRFEFEFTNGTANLEFSVKIIAVGDGVNYASSNPTIAKFTYRNEESQTGTKLILGTIGYDMTNSIIYWEKVEHAVNYSLTISGEGATSTVNKVIDDDNYVESKNRYEYIFITGVLNKKFDVKLIAVGDGNVYLSSNPTNVSYLYRYGAQAGDEDYSSIEYYASLGLEIAADSEVKDILHDKLNNYVKVSYGDARYAIVASDISVSNPNKIYGIYNSMLFDKVWDGNKINREHVWPCARLGTGRPDNNTKAISSDLHNLRVIQPSINSTRSDKYFIQGTSAQAGNVGSGFYPGDEHKGDVARICFYMVTMYSQLTLVNYEDLPNAAAYTLANAFMADLDDMLRWHFEDPVDEFEIYRNEVLFGYQKNRNPYIDFPDLVTRVFLNGNGLEGVQSNDSFYKVDFASLTISLIGEVYVEVSKSSFM